MKEHFLSYEQSLEVKKLGFDEGCLDQYNVNGELCGLRVGFIVKNELLSQGFCSAALYQQAFRWFRDKKLCDGSICRYGDSDGEYSYRWDILYDFKVCNERHFKKGYETYEQAENACIDEIIELIKNKQCNHAPTKSTSPTAPPTQSANTA